MCLHSPHPPACYPPLTAVGNPPDPTLPLVILFIQFARLQLVDYPLELFHKLSQPFFEFLKRSLGEHTEMLRDVLCDAVCVVKVKSIW